MASALNSVPVTALYMFIDGAILLRAREIVDGLIFGYIWQIEKEINEFAASITSSLGESVLPDPGIRCITS